MKFDFQLGTPFTPFQQLMGVLPEDSKEHVPSAYRVRLLVEVGADCRI
jgi:5'-3' exoribonuclease 1